jgi:hypothetical protein
MVVPREDRRPGGSHRLVMARMGLLAGTVPGLSRMEVRVTARLMGPATVLACTAMTRQQKN